MGRAGQSAQRKRVVGAAGAAITPWPQSSAAGGNSSSSSSSTVLPPGRQLARVHDVHDVHTVYLCMFPSHPSTMHVVTNTRVPL